jgi:hypothetical protein
VAAAVAAADLGWEMPAVGAVVACDPGRPLVVAEVERLLEVRADLVGHGPLEDGERLSEEDLLRPCPPGCPIVGAEHEHRLAPPGTIAVRCRRVTGPCVARGPAIAGPWPADAWCGPVTPERHGLILGIP